jgi:diguanylate cyclase (GGDEF)-like protein/PAS domain S-box-containing protein
MASDQLGASPSDERMHPLDAASAMDCGVGGPDDSSSSLDQLTGVGNLHGFMGAYSSYMADLHLHHVPFAVIFAIVPLLGREVEAHGREHGDELMKACADAIVGVVGDGAFVSRFAANQFAILCRYDDPSEIVSLATKVRAALEGIDNVDGRLCSVFARTRILYAEDSREFEAELISSLKIGRHLSEDAVMPPGPGIRSESMRAFFEEIPFGISIVRKDGRIDYWNSAAELITGYSAEEMIGSICSNTPLQALQDDGMPMCETNCPLPKVIKGNSALVKHSYLTTKQGMRVLVRNTYTPLRNNKGELQEIAWFFERETTSGPQDSLFSSVLERPAVDSITGLPGRSYLESHIEEKLEEFRRTGALFAFLLADIDDFRDFNNLYGHDVGDRILREFGDAISKNSRRTDRWGRWDGDEFGAILAIRSRADIDGAAVRFYDIADGIHIEYGRLSLGIRVSIGITAVRVGDDAAEIVSRADRYLSKAKESGLPKKIVSDNSLLALDDEGHQE